MPRGYLLLDLCSLYKSRDAAERESSKVEVRRKKKEATVLSEQGRGVVLSSPVSGLLFLGRERVKPCSSIQCSAKGELPCNRTWLMQVQRLWASVLTASGFQLHCLSLECGRGTGALCMGMMMQWSL
jgi:hypothetical protein